MQPVGRGRGRGCSRGATQTGSEWQCRCLRVLEDAEDLADRDGAGGGRWKAAHAPVMSARAMVVADGRAFFRLVAREILEAEAARVGRMRTDLRDDGPGDFAFEQAA